MTITNRTFFSALGESGYVHGKTMQMAFRTAKEDRARMPSLVDDVLKNSVEILVVSSPSDVALPLTVSPAQAGA